MLVLLLALSVSLLRHAAAQSFFPCHPTKPDFNTDVTCSRVVLPPGLCKRCPLRPTLKDGRFEQCARIYDTDSPECHAALQEYVDENDCDPVRAAALPKMLAGDNDATKVIDYFLYSVCEQCCDCIPMGTEKTDYSSLADSHQNGAPTLWKEDRGNCPAHAHFDVCKVVPNVTYFAKPGDPEISAPKACPMLREWNRSPEAAEWQTNPETNIVPELKQFLTGLLRAVDCDDFAVWGRCYDMENKQNHLQLPDDYEEPDPDDDDDSAGTEPPTTTTQGDTTTQSTTTATSATTDTSESSTSTTTTTSTPTTTTSTTEPESPDTTTVTTTSTTTTDTDSTTPTETTAPNPTSEDTDSSSTTSSSSAEPAAESDSTDPASDGGPPTDTESNAIGNSGEETSTSSSGQSAEPTDNPAPSIEGDSGTCFPATATVQLESGEVVPISDLRIGDSVLVSKDTFSEVFLFSHRTASSASYYLEVLTDVSNKTLTVTSGHYLHVNDGLVPAELVKQGDRILTASNGWERISMVRVVQSHGLYNPHTVHGDIAVDGIVASTYTTAVSRRIAVGLLTPLRALYWQGFVSEEWFGGFLSEGYRSLSPSSVESRQ